MFFKGSLGAFSTVDQEVDHKQVTVYCFCKIGHVYHQHTMKSAETVSSKMSTGGTRFDTEADGLLQQCRNKQTDSQSFHKERSN